MTSSDRSGGECIEHTGATRTAAVKASGARWKIVGRLRHARQQTAVDILHRSTMMLSSTSLNIKIYFFILIVTTSKLVKLIDSAKLCMIKFTQISCNISVLLGTRRYFRDFRT